MSNFLNRRWLTWVVVTVLLAAMVPGATACNSEKGGEETTTTTAATMVAEQDNTVGEGQTTFTFEITFPDGTAKTYTVRTDEETVGAALVKVGLIAGEESTYGLYVKTVDGVTADWDKDGKYWAFYENGQMAAKGVDKTPLVAGATYAFRAE